MGLNCFLSEAKSGREISRLVRIKDIVEGKQPWIQKGRKSIERHVHQITHRCNFIINRARTCQETGLFKKA